VILDKIKAEVAKHSPEELQTINEFCIATQKGISIFALGARIAKKFNLELTAGIHLANAWNRYLLLPK